MNPRFVLLLTALIFCISAPAYALFKAGDKAPDFSSRTLDDQEIKLSDLKGKTLLIEMGTTWCPSCNELAHQINELRDFLKENEVTFISIYLADSPESIKEHNKDEKLKPADVTLIDDGDARRNYSVFSIPRLLLIDKDFKIVFDEMVLSGSQIKQRIENLRLTN
jgi:thiol-disulfide isomerase/thioredoxin